MRFTQNSFPFLPNLRDEHLKKEIRGQIDEQLEKARSEQINKQRRKDKKEAMSRLKELLEQAIEKQKQLDELSELIKQELDELQEQAIDGLLEQARSEQINAQRRKDREEAISRLKELLKQAIEKQKQLDELGELIKQELDEQE